MNKLCESLVKGTLGELLVQIRLLQYGVQAAPPLKDSGNDLIAVRNETFKAIQVKATGSDKFDLKDLPPRRYHLVALVKLEGEGNDVDLSGSQVFMLEKKEAESKRRWRLHELEGNKLDANLVEKLFGN
jgi:hypothetical protein